MKIIYTGIRAENYDARRAPSFEYQNFFEVMRNMPGLTVVEYPYDDIVAKGKERFNQDLLELVKREKPDLLFAFMFSEELDFKVLDEIKKLTKSVAWFADDSWRFWNYSRFYAPHFTWAVTTYSWMPELYRRYGQPNVIRSQWAANLAKLLARQPDEVKGDSPDITFIGGYSRPRAKMIETIERVGVKVTLYGRGWPKGKRVSTEEMIRLFGTSKINLGLNPAPGLFNANSLGRLFLKRTPQGLSWDWHIIRNFESWMSRQFRQIKARHFEIPAYGGFVLTEPADDLEKFYTPGKEIVLYESTQDLIDKIHYYLKPENEPERKRIARAAYERTIREHTYEQRFREIFKKIGLDYNL